jgi:hypothetical protein
LKPLIEEDLDRQFDDDYEDPLEDEDENCEDPLGQYPFKENKPGEIKRKGNILEASINTTNNPANFSIEEIVDLFKLDKNKWECTGYTAKSWNTTIKNAEGEPELSTNYSVKAVFKLKQQEVIEKADLSWLFDVAREASFSKFLIKPKINYERNKSDNTLVLAIFDQHLGKLAWGEETGENYDIKIASKRFLENARSIIDRSVAVGFSKIIFPIGNDFSNLTI